MKLGEVDIEKDVFVIAEIGGNHEGDFEKAKMILRLAAESGAHAIKFQTYKGDKIVSKVTGSDRNKHFKKFELSHDQFIELAKMCKNLGKMFMSSVWDIDALNDLDPYMDIYKVGSGDLTNYFMLEEMAKRGKPLIISTAMSNLEEVRETVMFIESINPDMIKKKKLILLHCVAMYGEPKDDYANLLAIETLKKEFPNLHIGYSDHTKGIYACEIAVGMGAKVIEKHFTYQKEGQAFRDHEISAEKEDMQRLMERIKQIKTLHGSFEKKPVSEIETPDRIRQFRRAVYPLKDLKKGELLSKENITTLRPNEGIDARKYFDLIGKRLNKDKKAFEALYPEDLE